MKSVAFLLVLTLALGDAATTAGWSNWTAPDWSNWTAPDWTTSGWGWPTTTAPTMCRDMSWYQWQTMEQMFYYKSDAVVYGKVAYGDMHMDVVNVLCVLKNKGELIPSNITIWAPSPDSTCGSNPYPLIYGVEYLLGLEHIYDDNYMLASNTIYQHAIYPYSHDQYLRAVIVCGLDFPMEPMGFDFMRNGCPPHNYDKCYVPEQTTAGATPSMTQSALFLVLAYYIL